MTIAITMRFQRQSAPPSADPYFVRDPLSSDLFMDPNSVTDGDGTEANPYNAFTAARVQSLSPGQHFVIKDGAFDWASLTNLPSGTESARCRIVAFPGHTPIGLCHPATTGGFDPHYGFGAPGAGAAYWDLVRISYEVPGRAGIVFGAKQWSLTELACNNIRVIDCSGLTSLAASDNGGILVFDGGSETVEVVRGQYGAAGASGGSGTNRALIWADYQRYLKLIGVDLNAQGTSIPFYYKHTLEQTEGEVLRLLQNCIIRNGSRGVLLCGQFFNLLNNAFGGVYLELGDQGGAFAGRGKNTMRRNTFRDSTIGMTVQGTGGENFDNIFGDSVVAGTSQLWDNPYGAVDFRTLSSFNAYDGGSSEIVRNSTNYSLSSYRAAFPDREINSVAGTISFAGSISASPADWALAGGSTGKNAASDGSDCGVDVTKLLTTSV